KGCRASLSQAAASSLVVVMRSTGCGEAACLAVVVILYVTFSRAECAIRPGVLSRGRFALTKRHPHALFPRFSTPSSNLRASRKEPMHRYRNHTCGDLRESHIGQPARLSGWVHRVRDHG